MPSEAQVRSRAKFKFIGEWMVPFHPYFSVGLVFAGKYQAPIANAVQLNYHQAFSGESPNISVNYQNLIISKGPMAMVENPEVYWSGPDCLTLTWSPNEIRGTAYNDQLILVLYSPELHRTDGFIGNAIRINARCNFSPEPVMRGKLLHVYLSVVSLNRRRVADSKYLGILEPFI